MPKPELVAARHAGWIAATRYAQQHLSHRREHATLLLRLTGDKAYERVLQELDYIAKHLQSVCDAIVED
jgi:hypothetical protein